MKIIKPKEKDRKYKILQYLKQLPYDEYRLAKKKLPLALKVSKRTFERWIYLEKDSKQEIPADKLAVISSYLDIESMEQLFNYDIPSYNKSNLEKLTENENLDSDKLKLLKELNLTK